MRKIYLSENWRQAKKLQPRIIVYLQKRNIMETLVIHPKDKAELHFFLELAQRLGTSIITIDEWNDEQLLKAMEENLTSGETDKENVLNTLNNILNEDQPPYNNEG